MSVGPHGRALPVPMTVASNGGPDGSIATMALTSFGLASAISQPNAQFYLMHRSRPTEIGKSIIDLEDRYYAKLGILFPERSAAGRRALYAFFFGLIFAPGVDNAVIANGIDAFRDVRVK